jgi:hypothetical protein
MDATGETAFCGSLEFGTGHGRPRIRSLSRRVVARVALPARIPAALARATRDLTGTKPIEFYHWPGQSPQPVRTQDG